MLRRLNHQKGIAETSFHSAREHEGSRPKENSHKKMNRREFLSLAAVPAFAVEGSPRKKIAAICSTYHVRSHADDLVTRFLEGYWINDKFYPPPCDIVSLYLDQTHPADIAHRLSSAYGFPIVPSISAPLTLGTRPLAVDRVLIVC